MAEEGQTLDTSRLIQAEIDRLWNDKKLGPAIRRSVKERHPEIQIPEDTFDPLLEPLRAENEKLSGDLKAIREMLEKQETEKADALKKRQEEDFITKAQDARKQFALTDEGYDQMLERMKTTGNYTDPHAAAAFITSQNPPPQQQNGLPWLGPQEANIYGSAELDESRRMLHENPERYFENEVRKCYANPRGYVGEVMGENYARIAFGQ